MPGATSWLGLEQKGPEWQPGRVGWVQGATCSTRRHLLQRMASFPMMPEYSRERLPCLPTALHLEQEKAFCIAGLLEAEPRQLPFC